MERIWRLNLKKLDGNIETVIYTATQEESLDLTTKDVIPYNVSYSTTRDNFALCMFRETDACDLNWEDDSFVLINKKDLTQKKVGDDHFC